MPQTQQFIVWANLNDTRDTLMCTLQGPLADQHKTPDREPSSHVVMRMLTLVSLCIMFTEQMGLECRPQEPDEEEEEQVQDQRSRYRRRASSDSEDMQSDTRSRRSPGRKPKKNRAGREDPDLSDDGVLAGMQSLVVITEM